MRSSHPTTWDFGLDDNPAANDHVIAPRGDNHANRSGGGAAPFGGRVYRRDVVRKARVPAPAAAAAAIDVINDVSTASDDSDYDETRIARAALDLYSPHLMDGSFLGHSNRSFHHFLDMPSHFTDYDATAAALKLQRWVRVAIARRRWRRLRCEAERAELEHRAAVAQREMRWTAWAIVRGEVALGAPELTEAQVVTVERQRRIAAGRVAERRRISMLRGGSSRQEGTTTALAPLGVGSRDSSSCHFRHHSAANDAPSHPRSATPLAGGLRRAAVVTAAAPFDTKTPVAAASRLFTDSSAISTRGTTAIAPAKTVAASNAAWVQAHLQQSARRWDAISRFL
jgi:hypothetical protein